MATTVATAEAELQRRLRIGTGQTAFTDANLFDVMNKVQKTINYALKRKLSTGTLTLASSATTLFYTTTAIADDCLSIRALYKSSRTIMYASNWRQMQQYDSSWYRSAPADSTVLVWAPIGRNMIAVYPGSTTTNTELTCVYLADTTTLDGTADTFNLADQDMAIIYDLCEIVLLAHLRLVPECSRKVEAFQKNVLPYIEGGEWV